MTFNVGDRVRYFGPCAQGDKSDLALLSLGIANVRGLGGWIGIMENACMYNIYTLN